MKAGIASREINEVRAQKRNLVERENRSFWTGFWVAVCGTLLWFFGTIVVVVLLCVALIRFTGNQESDRASGRGLLKGTLCGFAILIAVSTALLFGYFAYEKRETERAQAEEKREAARRASEYAKEVNAQRIKDVAAAEQRQKDEAVAQAKREEEYARMRAVAEKERIVEDKAENVRRSENDASRAELQRAFEARQAKTNEEEQARVREMERQKADNIIRIAERRAGLVKDLASVRGTLGDLNKSFEPLSAAVRVGQNEITSAQKRMTGLQSLKPRPDNYDVLIRKYEAERDSGQSRAAKAQNEISHIKSEIATAEAKIRDLQSQIDSIDGK